MTTTATAEAPCYCGAGCVVPGPLSNRRIRSERDVVAQNIAVYGGMLIWVNGETVVSSIIDSLEKYDATGDTLPLDEDDGSAGKASPEAKARRAAARKFALAYEGHNEFVLDVADKLRPPRRGRLTSKMVDALLGARDREAAKAAAADDQPDDVKRAVAWMESVTGQGHDAATYSEFAYSVLQGYRRYGSMTDKQLAAVLGAADRDAAQERLGATETAGEGWYSYDVTGDDGRDETRIAKVQKAAHGSGRLYAKRLDPEGGWVYEAGLVGRLDEGMRLSVEDAAVFGKLYGVCAVCGRTLTDETSIEAGIGPVCRKRLA